MIVVYIVVLLFMTYAIIYKSKRYLHMLQQNLYNENNRYIRYLIKSDKSFISFDIITIIVCIFGIILLYDLIEVSICLFVFISVLEYLEACKYKKIIMYDQNKKPLVVTARVKRLIFSICVLYLIPVIFIFLNLGNLRFIWIMFLIESIMIYFNNFVVFIGNIINFPIEKLVYLYYKTKATNKLNSMNNLKIVGITGSYGKTSSKNILSEVLSVKYNCLPTPKNLNTFNGLIMTINNYMDKFTEIFIAEMGAYVKGEIKRLCKLVKPKYGILTRIGTAHLETFGSQENIQKGKFELIESLPKDGIAVLNGDDPLQVSYNLKNKVKVVWIGIDNHDVDLYAENIKCMNRGTTFDVYVKKYDKKYSFETKLLGNHNVYNILASIALAIEFDINMDDIIDSVSRVNQIEHRLELKKLGNFYQIDDAYNSNPVGASNACQILGKMPGIKIVVTPGMIELGDKEYELNKEFGEEIAGVADYVILIGEKRTKAIKEGILTKGYDKNRIVVYNDVRASYGFIRDIACKSDEDVYALFENDLPDTYNE